MQNGDLKDMFFQSQFAHKQKYTHCSHQQLTG